MAVRYLLFLACSLFAVMSAEPAFADEITYLDETGQRITMQARLLGTGRGFQALERTDGQIQLIESGALLDRTNLGDTLPCDCQQLAARLTERFGSDLTRVEIKDPFVVAMVLAAPLDPPAEIQAQAFLEKACTFMQNVHDVFEKYAHAMHFPVRELRYPLVLLIFESDADFNAYAVEASGGQGLSASLMQGFYSSLTNWLAVRMSSCDSFEVPWHEAIHQQVYNRVLQRLAPIPMWFDEGIASSFEGNGERLDANPEKINARYAQLAQALPADLRWTTIVAGDDAFIADGLAGNAHTVAWCLHWLLVTKYPQAYQNYVLDLARREPLSVVPADEQLQSFESAIGSTVAALQGDFPRSLQQGLRQQKVNLAPRNPPGTAIEQQALGQFKIRAVPRPDQPGKLQVSGSIRNISPLRALTFYVTVETGAGLYADWVVADLKPKQQATLKTQVAAKTNGQGGDGTPGTYRVFVKSVPAGSAEALEWKQGRVPGPISTGP